MYWRLVCTPAPGRRRVEGTFDDALDEALRECTVESSEWTVSLMPAEIRMAEVAYRQPVWVIQRLSGPEIMRLMRRHRTTIAELAATMGITRKRIREVRERGLDHPGLVRDWLQAITGCDLGPLPKRYRTRASAAATECCGCGCRLGGGSIVYEYARAAYCSVTCCRHAFRVGRERPA